MTKRFYSLQPSKLSNFMLGNMISHEEPYQIEFSNLSYAKGKPKPLGDFVYIRSPLPLSDINYSELAFSPQVKVQYHRLTNIPGLSQKAFDLLKDLLPLTENSKIFTFYFEQKPFYKIQPPYLLKESSETSREMRVQALQEKPTNWHYFRMFCHGEHVSVTSQFKQRVEEHQLTGVDFR